MRGQEHFRQSALRVLSVIGMSLAISACTPPPSEEDPHSRYPISAEKVTFAVAMTFEQYGESIRAEDEAVFRKFVMEYQRRGRSSLTVATTGTTTPDEERAIVSRLVAEGISSGAIGVLRGKAEGKVGKVAVFSFSGYLIKVPECGNWDGETGFNPSNLPHTNFGCSYQRNIGLMLSDPGDLVTSKGVVEADSRRIDNTIRVFREGAAAGSDLPKGEKGKFASPSQEQ